MALGVSRAEGAGTFHKEVFGRVRAKSYGTQLIASFLTSGRDEAKEGAVYFAVSGKLKDDGNWPPNDVTHDMGPNGYRYDAQSMPIFLKAVQKRLSQSLPPFEFDFGNDPQFVAKAIGLKVYALMAEIVLKTT